MNVITQNNEEIELEYIPERNRVAISFEHVTDFDFTELAYIELDKESVAKLIYYLQDIRNKFME